MGKKDQNLYISDSVRLSVYPNIFFKLMDKHPSYDHPQVGE